MELSYQLLAGALGALASVLLLGLASPVIVRLRSYAPQIWRESSVTLQLAYVALQIFAGLGLGLLFWPR